MLEQVRGNRLGISLTKLGVPSVITTKMGSSAIDPTSLPHTLVPPAATIHGVAVI